MEKISLLDISCLTVSCIRNYSVKDINDFPFQHKTALYIIIVQDNSSACHVILQEKGAADGVAEHYSAVVET